MTAKAKKTKRRISQSRRLKIARLHGSIEDDLFWLAGGETEAEPRWNRPRKQRISLRVDCEVVDWFKSKGAGIPDADQPDIATSNGGRKETGTALVKLRRLRGPFDNFALLNCSGQAKARAARRNPEQVEGPQAKARLEWGTGPTSVEM